MKKSLHAILAAAAIAANAAGELWCLGTGALNDGGVRSWSVSVPPAADVRTVVTVRVHLTATHPWIGDLGARLRSPSGVEVVLLDRPGMPSTGYPGPWGCGGDNLDVWFDDAASATAESTCVFGATPAMSGSLRPSSALAGLRGVAPQGVWTLTASDAIGGDAGTLTLACIELVTAPDCNANGVDDAIDIAGGTSADGDGDGVPDECGCRADLDGDGIVGGSDLAALLGAWGGCASCPADLTGDGSVLADDLAIVLSSWGACGVQ